MSPWTTFIILVGLVGSLLTIYEFIRARTNKNPGAWQLTVMFGAVTLALVLVSVIFANILYPLFEKWPVIVPTQTPNLTGTPTSSSATTDITATALAHATSTVAAKATISARTTAATYTTPPPSGGGTLTVQFAFIPQQVKNGSWVRVGATTNEPGVTIHLQVSYNAYPYNYQSGTQVTGGDGNATLTWNVQVSTSNTNAVAKVTAVATDGHSQTVTSDPITVQVQT